jgi:hypothetical protein
MTLLRIFFFIFPFLNKLPFNSKRHGDFKKKISAWNVFTFRYHGIVIIAGPQSEPEIMKMI